MILLIKITHFCVEIQNVEEQSTNTLRCLFSHSFMKSHVDARLVQFLLLFGPYTNLNENHELNNL